MIVFERAFPEVKNFLEIYEETFGEGTPSDGMPTADDMFFHTRVGLELAGWLVGTVGSGLLHVKYGGMRPEYRGATRAHFDAILARTGCSVAMLATRRENVAMQRLALSTGFLIQGVCVGADGKLEIVFKKEV